MGCAVSWRRCFISRDADEEIDEASRILAIQCLRFLNLEHDNFDRLDHVIGRLGAYLQLLRESETGEYDEAGRKDHGLRQARI